MSIVNEDAIIKLFRFDSFVCAVSGTEPLKSFMMKKHKWDEETYKEYYVIYLESFTVKNY